MFRPFSVSALTAVAVSALTTFGYANPTFDPTPNKLDFMVLQAHPDDEGYFFGSPLPHQLRVAKRSGVIVNMVTDRTTTPWRHEKRRQELRNAAAIYGFKYEPIFAEFLDHATLSGGIRPINNAWDAWDGDLTDGVADKNNNGVPDGREAAARFMAKQIRKHRPDVLLAHDFDGEYGHGAHNATGYAAADAWALAADASVDIDGLAAWQAKKLYIHQSRANGLGTTGETFINWMFHDHATEVSIDYDGDGIAESTPLQIADLGLAEHKTQSAEGSATIHRDQDTLPRPFTREQYSEWWGLYKSTVGADTFVTEDFTFDKYTHRGSEKWARGDFFENVPEPSSLSLLALGGLALMRRRRSTN